MQDRRVDASAFEDLAFDESSGDRDPDPVLRQIHPRNGYARTKRVFDLVVATLLLIASSPIWLLSALLIRLTSRGPVVFGQTRIGRHGCPFTCFKFRTMVDGAHDLRHELLIRSSMDGPVFKSPDDPRVTRVGRWMRKFSIDELPQLLNVLHGEMSIVGPRPQSPEEVERYHPNEWRRLSVKPGLTCVWQVSGRSLVDYSSRMQMDLDYVSACSFLLDCGLVLRTVPAVLTGRGAF
jgi:lipopolysaccharide/colanic/teichoic acid biosynthesis glycosyltransferase